MARRVPREQVAWGVTPEGGCGCRGRPAGNRLQSARHGPAQEPRLRGEEEQGPLLGPRPQLPVVDGERDWLALAGVQSSFYQKEQSSRRWP